MFPLAQNAATDSHGNGHGHQDIYTVHEKVRDSHEAHESYGQHYPQNDLQDAQQMQYQVSIQSNYIHVDQYGVPIENQQHYAENYVGLNDLNTSIHQGIEFSFDETTEEPTESDLGSADGDQLGSHMRQPIARCEQCGVTFRSFSGLYHHQKTHEGQLYKCPEGGCNKEYKTEHLLRRHLKVHRDHREGNLKCPHCEKTFCRADYLEIHIKRHLGQKDEKCPECGKGFVCKSDLIRHKLNVHSAYGRYQCPDCGKRLRSNTSLNRHRQSRLCIKQPFNYNNQQNGTIAYGYDEEEAVYEPRLDQESPLHTENSAVIVENAVSPLVSHNPTLSSTLNLGHHHEETSDLNLIEPEHTDQKFDVLLSNPTMQSPTEHQSVIQETSSYLNLSQTNAQAVNSSNPAITGHIQASILPSFNHINSHFNHQSHLAYSDINYVPVTSSSTDFLQLPQPLQPNSGGLTAGNPDGQLAQTLLQSI